MNKIQRALNVLAGIAIVVYAIYSFVYWFNNPSLSEMEVLIETWPALVAVILITIVIVGYSVYKDNDNK